MPDEIFSLRVYAKIISGRNYVCGLEWRTATEKVLVGDDKSDAQREVSQAAAANRSTLSGTPLELEI